MRRALLLLVTILAVQVAAQAQTGLTMTSVAATATMESIGVRAGYSGDTDGDATATVQYKRHSGINWQNAYTPIVDRRGTVHVNTGDTSNAANQNQARGSIAGLTPNTSYDVKFTWTDPDGVTVGSFTNPYTMTVTTSPTTPTFGGATKTVKSSGGDFTTIGACLNGTSAGDTCEVFASVSPVGPITVGRSGTAGAFRKLVVHSGDTVTVSAGTASPSVIVSADYVYISGFAITASSWADDGAHTISISDSQHDIYLVSNTSSDTSPNKPATGGARTGAVSSGSSVYNLYVLSNTFNETSLNGNFQTLDVDCAVFGTANHEVVFDSNSCASVQSGNGFNDGIGNGNSDIANWYNFDISRNSFTYYHDDCTEIDGSGNNVRFWQNTCRTKDLSCGAGIAGTLFSAEIQAVGPAYVFRNLFVASALCSYGKLSPNGFGFFFHNTVDTYDGIAGSGRSCMATLDGWLVYNNILRCEGNVYENNDNDASANITTGVHDWDYNNTLNHTGDFTSNFNGSSDTTCANFKSRTGYESHSGASSCNDPAFVDSTLKTLNSSSPGYDTGRSLDNFNSRDSAWGYSNNGPEQGYYEVNGYTYVDPDAGTTINTGAGRMRKRP